MGFINNCFLNRNVKAAAVSCILSGFSWADAMDITKRCESEGGSIYDVEIDLESRTGEIRYRWMGQDIFYTANITSFDEGVLKGIAEFQSSRSGETKGSSWIFTFDLETNVLTDNDSERSCR